MRLERRGSAGLWREGEGVVRTGVVNEYVDAPMALLDGGAGGFDRGVAADVDLECGKRTVAGRRFRGEFLLSFFYL